MKTEKELREAWNKVFKPVPMRKDGACLYCGIKPEVIADWWLSHRQAELDELVGKLEGEKKPNYNADHHSIPEIYQNDGWNSCLDKAIKVIKGINA